MFFSIRKSKKKQASKFSLMGIRLIQAHIDCRSQIEDFVNGKSTEKPSTPIGCQADCLLGEWLSRELEDQQMKAMLLDSLCISCMQFKVSASQVVVLTDMRMLETKEVALPIWNKFTDASEEFQQKLAAFHLTHMHLYAIKK